MEGFPPVGVLDEMPEEAAVGALRILFEDAPRFLRRLATARPFHDDEGLIGAARAAAEVATEDERRELVNAHPRIGGRPATMSPLSRGEQGLDERRSPNPGADLQHHLDSLNEQYEARFGFRFVTFVAGRSRAEIVPILEAALSGDRDAELARATTDTVRIAADRLATLRSRATRRPTIRA